MDVDEDVNVDVHVDVDVEGDVHVDVHVHVDVDVHVGVDVEVGALGQPPRPPACAASPRTAVGSGLTCSHCTQSRG